MAVPSAPTLSAQSLGDNVIRLRVTLPADAVSYKVFRNTHAAATTQIAAGETGRFYLDGAVVDNTTYWYRVKATNGDGDSVFSSEVTVHAGQETAPGATQDTGALRIQRALIGSR